MTVLGESSESGGNNHEATSGRSFSTQNLAETSFEGAAVVLGAVPGVRVYTQQEIKTADAELRVLLPDGDVVAAILHKQGLYDVVHNIRDSPAALFYVEAEKLRDVANRAHDQL